jgi:hypothetical protein
VDDKRQHFKGRIGDSKRRIRNLETIAFQGSQGTEAIGWEYVVCGYMSKAWAASQALEHPTSTLKGIQQQWLKLAVIQQNWQLLRSLWQSRNYALHSQGPSTSMIYESTVDAKITQWYTIQDTFAARDRTIF